MENKKVTEANREAWNEAAPIHQKNRKVNLKEEFKHKGYSTFDEIETGKLKEIGLKGKRAAQLCCNNGRETISLVNLGAESAVGFDISDEVIKEARELAEIAGVNCRFVRTDIYDIGKEYYDTFDFVYITVGSLVWMPDIEGFFRIASKMLKPGGTIMIYDEHPFTYMMAIEGDEEYDADDPMKIVNSYFRKEPWIDNDGIDYIGRSKYMGKTSYNFTRKISDIINALIKQGILITELNEYTHSINTFFGEQEKYEKMPLSYILIGQK